MGRHTKLTPKTHDAIIRAIEAGAYIETAAAHAGITKETLYAWLRRGRTERQNTENGNKPNEKEEPYAFFSDAVEKALGDAELRDVAIISKAAKEGQWQASAWRLERKFPDRWGRKNRVEVTGADGGHIQIGPAIDLNQLTADEIEILMRLTEKAQSKELPRGMD